MQISRRSWTLQSGMGVLLVAAACAAPAETPAAANPLDAQAQAPAPPDTAKDVGVGPIPAAVEEYALRPPAGRVLPGVNVLLASDGGPLRGLRVGLITNHTGRGADGTSTIDLLHGSDALELVALFSPEHGIRGTAEAGETIDSGVDERTGLPIHSLYGDTRTPTPAMLEGLDALAFDIQDIGARYYTYVWTMALALRAAAEHDLRFVVLDRPNPIGGAHMQGNVLDPEHASFVGLYPVPMRHGLTPGELARWIDGEFELGADLEVVPVQGWTRDMWYDETGLPWVAPSPNMPTLESATHYPGTCLFEATNLSVGRGTERAFQWIGAPWLDAAAVARSLNDTRLPGVRFEAVSFTPRDPGDGKWPDTEVRGVRFVATDREVYDPTQAAVAALVEIRRRHPDRLEIRAAGLDRLAGTERLRTMLLDGATAREITAAWPRRLAAFRQGAAGYLLYP
ncbi:MAG: exo-beta-N-acetylmuramidase NamZ family protein [Longimicrobiales bacterium]